MFLILIILAMFLSVGSILLGGTYLFVVGGEIGNYIVGALCYILAIGFSVPYALIIKDEIKDIRKNK